jgi:hypothetical protein
MVDISASAAGQAPTVYRARPIRISSTLEAEDVHELRLYARESGLFMPQRSTFAAQLKRAELNTFGSRNCSKCGGSKHGPGRGFVPANKRINYTRALAAYRAREVKRYGWSVCNSDKQRADLRACGLEAYTREQIALMFPEIPLLPCRECPACHGAGIIAKTSKTRSSKPLTARPTGSSKAPAEGGSEMDEASLHRRGKVDSRLAMVRARAPSCAGVLDAYYAPGAECLAAIYRFTKTGQRLLRQNHLGLTDRQFFDNMRDAQATTPDLHRGMMLANAEDEAHELLGLACQTWNTIMAENVARSARDAKGRPLEVGARVVLYDNGVRKPGSITSRKREFWVVKLDASTTEREVAGGMLERAA